MAIELVSGVSFRASASSWKVLESRFISWRYMSKIQECERNQLALRSCELCQHGLKIIDATLVLSEFTCICQLDALAYAWDGFKKHAAASGINCSDTNLSCGFGGYILLRR